MSQTVSITIDGKEGRVLPDSVGVVLQAVFALLDSIDKQSWSVGATRTTWKVVEAKLVNPITITAVGEQKYADQVGPDLPLALIERMEQVDRGVKPRDFARRELRWARMVGREARRSRSIKIDATVNGKTSTFSVSRSFSGHAFGLMKRPPVSVTEYGSLDGTLIKLVNDPLKEAGTATLRCGEDASEVGCHADPITSSRLAQFVNRKARVILYGNITTEDGIAKKIEVEDFTTIPDDEDLPTLEDIHALGFRHPGEGSVEEYLDELRGDD